MNPLLTSWGQVAIIVGGYLLGIYFQNRSIAQLDKRIDDLRSDTNNRFGDLKKGLDDRFTSLEKRLDDQFTSFEKRSDDRFTSFEKRSDDRFTSLRDFIGSEVRRLEARLDRLEHPVVSQ